MKDAMNVPYVKKFDENGKVINTIKGIYTNEFDNGKKRRENPHPKFYGESRNYHLTVTPQGRYLRYKQYVTDKRTGELKTIEHYLLKP